MNVWKKVYKRYVMEVNTETYCVFNIDETNGFAEINGAEHLYTEWYFFNLYTEIDPSRIDDANYINWLLFDKNDTNGFSCGSFDTLEELISSGKQNYYDASDLAYFLSGK